MCSITMTKFTGCHCRYIHMSRQFCHKDNAGLCKGPDCMARKDFLDDICPDCQRIELQYAAARKLNDEARARKEKEENAKFEQFRAMRNASALKGQKHSLDAAEASALDAIDTVLDCRRRELDGLQMPILTKVDTSAKPNGSHDGVEGTNLTTMNSAGNGRRRSHNGAHNGTLDIPPRTPSLMRQDSSSSPLVAARLASMASMASNYKSPLNSPENQYEVDGGAEIEDDTWEYVSSCRTPCSSPTEAPKKEDEAITSKWQMLSKKSSDEHEEEEINEL